MHIIKCKMCKEAISYHKLLIKKYPDYHCKPVDSSGNIESKIALIGLAPGLHGANKTGIPFTSDFSGEVIRNILNKLCLQDIFITNAVRCYPKNNKPSLIMINNCLKHTKREIKKFKKLGSKNKIYAAIGPCIGNKSYEVLYTIFDTTTGDIKQTRRVPHSNYISKKVHRQKSAFDYK